MEKKDITCECRIVRRPPFPQDEIREAVLMITRRFVESCQKARQLGRKHREQFDAGMQAVKRVKTAPVNAGCRPN